MRLAPRGSGSGTRRHDTSRSRGATRSPCDCTGALLAPMLEFMLLVEPHHVERHLLLLGLTLLLMMLGSRGSDGGGHGRIARGRKDGRVYPKSRGEGEMMLA